MDANNPSEAEQTCARNAAREAFLAVDFVSKSDMKRFGSLLAELENSYNRGVDGYPITHIVIRHGGELQGPIQISCPNTQCQ